MVRFQSSLALEFHRNQTTAHISQQNISTVQTILAPGKIVGTFEYNKYAQLPQFAFSAKNGLYLKRNKVVYSALLDGVSIPGLSPEGRDLHGSRANMYDNPVTPPGLADR